MNSLYKKIDKYTNAKENFLDFKYWNNTKHSNIISIDDKNYNPIGLIETCELDLQTGFFKFTLTQNPEKAMKFEGKISTILYHNLRNFNSGIKNHSHYPIKYKPIK